VPSAGAVAEDSAFIEVSNSTTLIGALVIGPGIEQDNLTWLNYWKRG
jgi:hypothetical protein